METRISHTPIVAGGGSCFAFGLAVHILLDMLVQEPQSFLCNQGDLEHFRLGGNWFLGLRRSPCRSLGTVSASINMTELVAAPADINCDGAWLQGTFPALLKEVVTYSHTNSMGVRKICI